jgi:hypothetical protein
LRRAHLHHDAAGEIDAEIEALGEQQTEGAQGHDYRKPERERVPPHEIDAGVGRNQMNRLPHERVS